MHALRRAVDAGRQDDVQDQAGDHDEDEGYDDAESDCG